MKAGRLPLHIETPPYIQGCSGGLGLGVSIVVPSEYGTATLFGHYQFGLARMPVAQARTAPPALRPS